jgi:ATP-dependent phosphoenolpyruvate carboxykinase
LLSPNALVGVLTLAALVMCLHYDTMMSTLVNCPVPFLFGKPGTGKTTNGANPSRANTAINSSITVTA